MDDTMIELTGDVTGSPLYNAGLAPTTAKQRNWGSYTYLALWIAMAFNMATFTLAGGLIGLGMNWWQAVLTIFLGNVIVLVPMLLNGFPGTKYGIPFPVLVRSSFGTLGANVPALMRAVVACGWFGIQVFIGGATINSVLTLLFPAWGALGAGIDVFGMTVPMAISFAFFWSLNIFILFKGMSAVKKLEEFATPFMVLWILVVTIWALVNAKGFGPILSQKGKLESFSSFLPVFIPSLTGMIGFWATLSLNIPDFTRFSKNQKSQVIGQSLGLPISMGIFAFMSVIISSATLAIYGEAIWDPSQLIAKFQNPFVVVLSLIATIFATLTTNIAANVVSPANDFSNVAPKKIDFNKGALITGIIGILIMPWKLLADPSGYIFGWLGTYSGVLGPIAGIMIADYFIIRKQDLNLEALYDPNGEYSFTKGFNINAILALVFSIVLALSGKVIPVLKPVSDYAWFIGLAVALILYWGLSKANLAGAPATDID